MTEVAKLNRRIRKLQKHLKDYHEWHKERCAEIDELKLLKRYADQHVESAKVKLIQSDHEIKVLKDIIHRHLNRAKEKYELILNEAKT